MTGLARSVEGRAHVARRPPLDVAHGLRSEWSVCDIGHSGEQHDGADVMSVQWPTRDHGACRNLPDTG